MNNLGTNNKINVIRVSTSSYQGEDFQAIEKQALESRFPILYQFSNGPKEDHIYITNSNTNIEDLKISEKTKLIIHPNSGYDNFNVKFVEDCPCPIIIGNEIRMNAVVSYTVSALLGALNKTPYKNSWDQSRLWERDLLEAKKILIIGYGHIGERVSEITKHLGGDPKIYDPHKGLSELSFDGVEVILLCASLNPTSEKIIDEEALKLTSPNLLIINGARGGLIDQPALIEFLQRNKKATAYLDVFESEPFTKNEFSNLENIFLTSHIAGVHNLLNSNIIEFECKVIESYLSSSSRLSFEENNRGSLLQNRIRNGFLI